MTREQRELEKWERRLNAASALKDWYTRRVKNPAPITIVEIKPGVYVPVKPKPRQILNDLKEGIDELKKICAE